MAEPTVPLPSPQGAFVDANGRPTPEFYRFLAALLAWAKAAEARLTALEP